MYLHLGENHMSLNKSDVFDELRKLSGKLTTSQVKAGDLVMDTMGVDLVGQMVGLESKRFVLTESQLKSIYPSANMAFVSSINKFSSKYGIDTSARMAMFLAQVIHESGGFNRLRESLGYTPERLRAVFPSRFKTVAAARAVTIKGQVAIGDSIYGGRMGNGASNGDGYKYRGGGLMHTTGKTNYTIATKRLKESGTDVDLVKNPEKIVEPDIAVETAMIFWVDNNLNKHADAKDVKSATKVINGGTNGLADRTSLYNKAIKVL